MIKKIQIQKEKINLTKGHFTLGLMLFPSSSIVGLEVLGAWARLKNKSGQEGDMSVISYLYTRCHFFKRYLKLISVKKKKVNK